MKPNPNSAAMKRHDRTLRKMVEAIHAFVDATEQLGQGGVKRITHRVFVSGEDPKGRTSNTHITYRRAPKKS